MQHANNLASNHWRWRNLSNILASRIGKRQPGGWHRLQLGRVADPNCRDVDEGRLVSRPNKLQLGRLTIFSRQRLPHITTELVRTPEHDHERCETCLDRQRTFCDGRRDTSDGPMPPLSLLEMIRAALSVRLRAVVHAAMRNSACQLSASGLSSRTREGVDKSTALGKRYIRTGSRL